MVNEDVKDRVIDFKMVRVDSDHLPEDQQEEEEENPTTEAE